ncbi:DNA alkylation repair protein [bacterium]|nr:DNA alkylation repair protein [bacterium]MBU1984937.1 DNA alkylation repair protein [bacterium]
MPNNSGDGESTEERNRELTDLAGQCAQGRIPVEELLAEFDHRLAGTPFYPPAGLFGLGNAVGEILEKTPAAAIDVALKLISSSVRETRGAAVGLIFRLARLQPGFWVDTARHLVTDDDWEVRDLAARVFDVFEDQDGAAEFHLAFVVEVVTAWVRDSDEQVRRAAPQALLGYALRHAEFRPRLLPILDPLLADPREYVRNSFVACLRTLGRADPDVVLDYLETAAARADETGNDTIRLALDHPFADRVPDRKARIIERLRESAQHEKK